MTDVEQQLPLLSPAAEKRLFDLAEDRLPVMSGLGSVELMEHGFESKSRIQLTPKGATEYWRRKGLLPPSSAAQNTIQDRRILFIAGGLLAALAATVSVLVLL